MKATDLLKSQHREVEQILNRLEGKAGKGERNRNIEGLATALAAHMAIEQEIFYPAYANAMNDPSVVREQYEEHGLVAYELRKLLEVAGDDPSFQAKCSVLRELLRHHIQEEERRAFRKAEAVMNDKRLEELGEALETYHAQVVEEGYHAVIAEGAEPDARDAERLMFQPPPVSVATRLMATTTARTPRAKPAAVRKLAAKEKMPVRQPTLGGGRRGQSSTGPQASNTRTRGRVTPQPKGTRLPVEERPGAASAGRKKAIGRARAA